MPLNGVEVRGLRVLHTHEDRRVPWWPALQAVSSFSASRDWSVVTVSSGPDQVVARRRFKRNRSAENARRRFVRLVAEMSDDDYATADWQTVLDGV